MFASTLSVNSKKFRFITSGNQSKFSLLLRPKLHESFQREIDLAALKKKFKILYHIKLIKQINVFFFFIVKTDYYMEFVVQFSKHLLSLWHSFFGVHVKEFRFFYNISYFLYTRRVSEGFSNFWSLLSLNFHWNFGHTWKQFT